MATRNGSRWSRAKRETTGVMADREIDPGGVADQIPGGVDSPRPLPKSGAFVVPVVSRFARDHRLPSGTPSGVKRGAARQSIRDRGLQLLQRDLYFLRADVAQDLAGDVDLKVVVGRSIDAEDAIHAADVERAAVEGARQGELALRVAADGLVVRGDSASRSGSRRARSRAA